MSYLENIVKNFDDSCEKAILTTFYSDHNPPPPDSV